MPGKYLKRAAEACAWKRRFDSPEEASIESEGRFGVYKCAVCGYFHLTSSKPALKVALEEGMATPEPRVTLGDLDWSALRPQTQELPVKPKAPKLETESRETVTVVRTPNKEGVALVVHHGKLERTLPIFPHLRSQVTTGCEVTVAILEKGLLVLVVQPQSDS
jgi:hypothetical protein